ncbi:MAG: phosphoribosyl-AMP cyclohydrolase [Eggerthellaceae bacterium]|nr:phosphoribosyl-AMP cyclohydrolase [Eggerthellaceae bacterium]
MELPELHYNEQGLIPCIVQDAESGFILMMAWMNEEALTLTLEQGTMWFWSRSRAELWHKGETSGSIQTLMEMRYDCDEDTLLAIVMAAGPACHTGQRSCFYRTLFEIE